MTNRKSAPKAEAARPHATPASSKIARPICRGVPLRVQRGEIPSTHASSLCCGHPLARRLPPSHDCDGMAAAFRTRLSGRCCAQKAWPQSDCRAYRERTYLPHQGCKGFEGRNRTSKAGGVNPRRGRNSRRSHLDQSFHRRGDRASARSRSQGATFTMVKRISETASRTPAAAFAFRDHRLSNSGLYASAI